MHTKRTVSSAATESAAQAALRRGSSPALPGHEEKVLRMRLGAGLPLSARLARIATASDTELELLAYEIEAHLFLKERRQRAAAEPPRTAPSTSRVKEKIVRALRRKS